MTEQEFECPVGILEASPEPTFEEILADFKAARLTQQERLETIKAACVICGTEDRSGDRLNKRLAYRIALIFRAYAQ